MAYGLQIINNANELLIDSNYVNPTFVQKLEFNTTPSAGEELAGTLLHPGYTRRYYTTSTVYIGTGSYIVLWALPDSSADVWYLFPSSVADNNLQFDCSVFASTSTNSTSYTLPTAYVFAVDANGLNAMTSTGPALRMYNDANPQKKTFDSNFIQLVPYDKSDLFDLPTNTSNNQSLSLSTPTNPIYLLPKSSILSVTNAIGASGKTDYLGTDIVFRRTGNTVYAKSMYTYYSREDYAALNVQFTAGTLNDLSVIVADADLYVAPGGGTGGGNNPIYNLSRSAASVNEGSSFTITLTITNATVANGTAIDYNVTGIQDLDLSAGSTTGSFIIYNNTASVGFTIANDTLTEGTETFRLELLTGTTPYTDVTVTINDTSITPPTTPTYSISPQTGNVNEGSSITFTVTTTNVANGTTLYWAINGGSADPGADFSSYNGSFTISSNSGTFTVYPTADATTEGSETFGVGVRTVSVTGTEVATSGTITINDTSITTVTYNESLSISPSTVSLSNYTTISISGGQPNATITYATTNYGDPQPSSFPGSVSLNGSGNYSNYLTGGSITGGVVGDKMLWVRFPYNGNIRSARVNVVADAGQAVGGQYCVGYTRYQNYTDGYGGTYASVVEYNSSSCGYNPPAAGQPVGSPYCVGYTRYQDYTDGNYGTYAGVLEYNSTACGYTPPAPPTATWSIVFSNNGSAGAIYVGVEVYLSAPTPTTVTFYFGGYVADNGAGFNVPSVTITAGNTASAGYEYSGFTNGSGPYSQLTLVAYPSSAPYSISPGSISNGFSYS
jgi:hypothetical protein